MKENTLLRIFRQTNRKQTFNEQLCFTKQIQSGINMVLGMEPRYIVLSTAKNYKQD